MYIKPKKSLGQNFLLDKNIQDKIVLSAGLSKENIVLEIGSGTGELSNRIAPLVKYLYALEIDQRLYPLLEKKLRVYPDCKIVKYDILKFDLARFLEENRIKQKIKVIGNIPYYITSPIIEHLINYRQLISSVYLTVQKEFGRRIIASAGSKAYGSFSCFVQYYAQSNIIFEIKRRSFKPVPKVDSCFLALNFREQPAVKVKNEEIFFKLIRTAFNQRRKTLRNSLENLFDSSSLEEAICRAQIEKNTRPEKLSLEQFADLSNFLENNQKNT